MAPRKRGRSVHTPRISIADPDAFAGVFRAIVDRYPHQGAAAKALGVHRTRVTQLGKRVGKSVGAELVKAMRRVLRGDPGAVARLNAAVLTPDQLDVLERYAAWIDSHFVHGGQHPGTAVYLAIMNRDRWAPYRSHLVAFRNKQKDAGHEETRVHASVLRALEPLAVGWRTRGIERTLEELDRRGELAAYLNASFKREEILLRRIADPLRRAQQVAPWR